MPVLVDSAPVITINNATTPSYTEGAAPVTAAPNANLTDSDNFLMAALRVAITDFQPGDVLSLDPNLSGGIAAPFTAQYDPLTGIFSFPANDASPDSSVDTVPDYLQGVLRAMQFSSTSADPTNGGANPTRTISWQIWDTSVATSATPLFQSPVAYATGAGTGPVALSNLFTDSLDTDVNGDLQTDLLTADATSGQVSVLVNHNGDGTFISPTGPFAAGANASSIAAGNFNEDIDPNNISNDMVDVVVGHSTGNTLSLLLGDGTGNFGTPTSITVGKNPQFVLVGHFNDINPNFHDDLVVANGGDANIMLLYGNGDGTFQGPVTLPTGADANASPVFIATAEFNAPSPNPPPEGPDFAIANKGDDSVTIYQGDGAGGFTRRPDILLASGSEPVGIATGDFNGDHNQDLAIADYGNNTITVEYGNGDGTFTLGPVLNTLGLHPTSIIAQDVDGNGRADLVVTDEGDASHNIDGDVEIFLADPLGGGQASANGFETQPIVISLPAGAHPTSVESADFNLDGNPDLAVTDPSTNNVYVLLHTPTTPSQVVTSTIGVQAVNNPPVATVPNAPYSATERTNLALQGTGLSVSDPDGNTGTETVTLSVGEGNITVTAGNSNISNLNNNGSGSVSFDGTLAELNALLGGASTGTIIYNDPSHTPAASTPLTLQIDDNGNTGGSALTTSAAQTIDITAVNEAPVASAPASYPFVAEAQQLPLRNTGFSVSDPDGGTAGENETATLSANVGRFNAVAGTGASSGVQISGNGTNTLTITGTIAQINGLLVSDNTSILTFTGNVDANDTPNHVTLSLSIDDNGFSGTGGPLTSNIAQATITPAPDDGKIFFVGLTAAGADGHPVEGQQITASVTDDGTTITGATFIWKAGGTVVGSGNTYTPSEADEGKPLTVDISFTDLGDSNGDVTESDPAVPVGTHFGVPSSVANIVQENPNENAAFTVAGLVNGHLAPNQQLTATVTEPDAPTSGITYTWQVDGVTRKTGVDSAGNTFTPVLGDESKTLSVSVAFTDTHGFAEIGTQTFSRPNVSYDLNGDSISDLVFTNNGQPGIWLWNGTAPTAETPVNSAGGAAWHVVTSRDMNGDAKSDLIWQNNDGSPGIWLMNGTTPLAEIGMTNPGVNWHLVAAGDVNGDANADLIWQDAGGTLGVWEMNGTTPIAEAGIANPGSTWKVVGAADFDHDGRDDILLQNTATGNLMIDLMNGTTIQSSVTITVGDPSWHAIGTGVFNGVTEIAWQNNNGTPGIWLMNGTTPTAEAGLANPGAGWQLVAMDHFTPDGKAGFLFQNTSGPMMLWKMNGTSVGAMVNLQTPDPGWKSVNGHPFASG
jgi:FG-GAP-like repeat